MLALTTGYPARAAQWLLVPEVSLTQGFTDHSRFVSAEHASAEVYTTIAPGLGAALAWEDFVLLGRGYASAGYRSETGETLFGGGHAGLGWNISERLALALDYQGAIGQEVSTGIPPESRTMEGGEVAVPPGGMAAPRAGTPLITAAQTRELVIISHSASTGFRVVLTPVLDLRAGAEASMRQQAPLQAGPTAATDDYAYAGSGGVGYTLSPTTSAQLSYTGGSYLNRQREATSIFHGGTAELRQEFSARFTVSAELGMRMAIPARTGEPVYAPVGGVEASYRWPRTLVQGALSRALVLDATLGGTSLSYLAMLGGRHQLLPQLELAVGLRGSWTELSVEEELGVRTGSQSGYVDYQLELVASWRLSRSYRLEGRFERYFTMGLTQGQGDTTAPNQGNAVEIVFAARWD
ncbi:MAG: hypothetical protein FJ125_15350 [Deltaproteobacteria bacterium]|nr:hypothetical protein [Deltaproteobacteria bacterium]